MNFQTCPRCAAEMSTFINNNLICQCARKTFWSEATTAVKRQMKYHLTYRQTYHQWLDRKAAVYLTILTLIATAAFSEAAEWGRYTFAAPLLRLEQVTGQLTPAGADTLAQAYIQVGDFSAAERAYNDEYHAGKNPETLRTLARFESRMNKPDAARATYKRYFDAGGNEAHAITAYAELLEGPATDAEALKYYEKAMTLHPGYLPIQEMGGVVRILMREGRYAEARRRLKHFYASAANAKGYFNTEFSAINAAMAGKKTARLPASQRTRSL